MIQKESNCQDEDMAQPYSARERKQGLAYVDVVQDRQTQAHLNVESSTQSHVAPYNFALIYAGFGDKEQNSPGSNGISRGTPLAPERSLF